MYKRGKSNGPQTLPSQDTPTLEQAVTHLTFRPIPSHLIFHLAKAPSHAQRQSLQKLRTRRNVEKRLMFAKLVTRDLVQEET